MPSKKSLNIMLDLSYVPVGTSDYYYFILFYLFL